MTIDEKTLENITIQVNMYAEQYEAELKSGNTVLAEKRSCYLNGISFVLEKLGYIIQYKDNTHVHIDTVENVVRKIEKR